MGVGVNSNQSRTTRHTLLSAFCSLIRKLRLKELDHPDLMGSYSAADTMMLSEPDDAVFVRKGRR